MKLFWRMRFIVRELILHIVLVLFAIFLLSCEVPEYIPREAVSEEVVVESLSLIEGTYQIVSFEEVRGYEENYYGWIVSIIGDVDVQFIINSDGVEDSEREVTIPGVKYVESTVFLGEEYKLVDKSYIYGYDIHSDMSRHQSKILKIEKFGSDFWFRYIFYSESHTHIDWSKVTLWKAKKVE
jgi:hypothetical protein